MSVPVISFSGDRHSSRVGASLLNAAGLDELVASDREEYIDKAVSLANDSLRLAKYKEHIREQLISSVLCDGFSFTQKVEAIYQKLSDGDI